MNYDTLLQIKEIVSTLDERSKNYTMMLERIDKKLEGHDVRLNSLDIRVTALESLKTMSDKLAEVIEDVSKINSDITVFKTDKRWAKQLVALIAAIIGALITQAFNIWFI